MASVRRLLLSACALTAGLALSGCESSDEDSPPFPPPATETFTAELRLPSASNPLPAVPFPWDGWFAGTTDLTLNIPEGVSAAGLILNPTGLSALDGFSTSAPMTTAFSLPINAASLNASTVRIVELYLSDRTFGPA